MLSIVLTAFFCLFAAIGLGAFLMGKIPLYSLIIVVAYICVAAALNRKGGSIIRIIAYIVSFIFMGCGLLFIALVVSLFFNNAYDYITPIVLATFGIVGTSTFICFRKTAV
ncbi:hypothetical protein AAD001_10280 [Colwelliaceae bacterium 6471]